MILIGAGQGGTLGPLTAAGIAGVAPEDAGAASGLVNVAHQLGGSLGLGILVTGFAGAAGSFAARASTSLTIGSLMLALALVIPAAVVVRGRRSVPLAAGAPPVPSTPGTARQVVRS